MDFTYNILELKYAQSLEPLANYYDVTTRELITQLMDMCKKNHIYKGCYVDVFDTICRAQSLHTYELIEERVKSRYNFLVGEAIANRPYGMEIDQLTAAVQCRFPWTKADQKRALIEAYCNQTPSNLDVDRCVTVVDCLRLAHEKLVTA